MALMKHLSAKSPPQATDSDRRGIERWENEGGRLFGGPMKNSGESIGAPSPEDRPKAANV